MTWKIDKTQAEFHFNQWRGHADLSNAAQGFEINSPEGSSLTNLLGVSFHKPYLPLLQDCYSRINDLVVVYPQREARNFNLQLDYRLLESTSETLLIELWISIQTYLLDTHPAVSVLNAFDHQSLIRYQADGRGELSHERWTFENSLQSGSERAIAVVSGRSANQNFHLAWLNHPKDQPDTHWQMASENKSIQASLFGHFMEKGVIRRGRMRCLISTKPLDRVVIEQTYRDFTRSPLPLTA